MLATASGSNPEGIAAGPRFPSFIARAFMVSISFCDYGNRVGDKNVSNISPRANSVPVEMQARCSVTLGRAALRGDLRSSDEFAVIAPRAALVVDDVGDVDIAQDAGEWRHGGGIEHTPGLGALQSIQHDANVLRRVVLGDDTASLDRRVRPGPSLPLLPRAGGAGGRRR